MGSEIKMTSQHLVKERILRKVLWILWREAVKCGFMNFSVHLFLYATGETQDSFLGYAKFCIDTMD